MVLLIGETIGWQELIFIGILALIFLGPRKLPQMAKTIGKYMAEFRRAANEFKTTWENEVSTIKEEFGDAENDVRMLAHFEDPKPAENSIGRSQGAEEPVSASATNGNKIELPVVREIDAPPPVVESAPPVEAVKESKKDWL